MIKDHEKQTLPKRCKYCNAKFPPELIDKLQDEDDDPAYCELCGAEIRIPNHELAQDNDIKKDTQNSHKKEKKQ
jgi:hypothetical protein